MLERIDRLVFYFTVECASCHNKLKASHVAIEEQKGAVICTLCGRTMKVPDSENLLAAAKKLNEYLGAKENQKYIKLTMNEAFAAESDVPAAAH